MNKLSGQSYNTNKLYRNPSKGFISGICAGLADYMEVDARLIRIIAVILLFSTFPLMVFIYLAAHFLLDRQTEELQVLNAPKEQFARCVRKFDHIEERLQTLERCVTSKQFELRRKIDNL